MKKIKVKNAIIKKVIPNNKNKKPIENSKKFKIATIVLSVLLSCFIGLSIFMIGVNQNRKIDTNLGKTINFNLSGVNNQVNTIYLPSGILNGSKLKQYAFAKNTTTTPYFIRFKLVLTYCNDKEMKNIETTCDIDQDKWIKNGEYYYLNSSILNQETLMLFDNIVFPKFVSKSKTACVSVMLECLDSSLTATQIWNVPDNWLE